MTNLKKAITYCELAMLEDENKHSLHYLSEALILLSESLPFDNEDLNNMNKPSKQEILERQKIGANCLK